MIQLTESGDRHRAVPSSEVIEEILAELDEDLDTSQLLVQNDVSEAVVRTDLGKLVPAVVNVLENAFVHATTDRPAVSLVVTEAPDDAGTLQVVVMDTNVEIPDSEVSTLNKRAETALEHGQGIGLSIVDWCVLSLMGTLAFDYKDGNVVTITLPNTLEQPR